MEYNITRELNVNEMEQVNGGNPLLVMLAVQGVRYAAKKAAPHVKTAMLTAIATIAGAAGYEAGRNS